MPSLLDIAEKRLAEEDAIVGKKKGTLLDQVEYELNIAEPAPKGTLLDKAAVLLKSQNNPVLKQRYTDSILNPKEIDEKSWFKGYYRWLHSPTERAIGVWDFLSRVAPKSVSGTAVALGEFPYHTIKAFTDPMLEGFEETAKSKPQSLEEYKQQQGEIGWDITQKIGKSAFDLIDGMAKFFGEPIGLYGWEKLKDKWLSDPAGSVVAVAPLVKGAAVGRPGITKSVSEFGKATGMQKAYDWIDIQAPFERVGAKNTGIAFKNQPSLRIVEQNHARATAKEIKDLKIPIENGLDITLEAANSRHPHAKTPEIKQAAKKLETYYNEAYVRQNKDGVLANPWPKSQILRNESRIEALADQIKINEKAINKERSKTKQRRTVKNEKTERTSTTKTQTEGGDTAAPESATRVEGIWIDRVKDAMKERGFSEGESNIAIHHIRGDRGTTSKVGNIIKEKTTETVKIEKIIETVIDRVQPDIGKIRRHRESIEKMRTEVAGLQGINTRLKSEKPKYTHIPLNSWYEKIRDTLGEANGDAVWNRLTSKYHKGRFYKARKTVDVGDLIQDLVKLEDLHGKKIFDPMDFDARMIMAKYAQGAGGMRGMAKVFNAAYADGLIVKAKGLPPKGFSLAPPDYTARFPELKHRYINDAFMLRLADNIRRTDRGMKLGRIMGYTKMMAFYNPFFLPIYDTWQSSWAMGPQLANPKYWKRAYKSMRYKDKAYWESAEGGSFATPFSPPFENFKRDITNTLEGRTLERLKTKLVERGKNPAKLVDDFYRGVWNMAWTGDNFVRMVTNHYLREKGYGPVEAGQLTAYFHGDYARLTPQSRRILNKVFFTPSFKYTMGHVQANMAKSSIKVMNDALHLRKPAKRDALLAKGAAMLIAGEMAKNKLMEMWGFKTEDWGMRYAKTVETDEGEKELVLYWPDPNNTILRQVHKWSNWGDEPEKLDKAIQKISWDLHPLWKLSTELLTNKGINNEVIYNMFDSNGRLTDGSIIAKDIAHYSVSRLVAAGGAVERYVGTKDKRSAYKELQNELGFIHEKFLSAVTLAYLRNPKEIRVARQMVRLQNLFKKFTKSDEPKTDKEADRRIDNFWDRLQDIEKQLEE